MSVRIFCRRLVLPERGLETKLITKVRAAQKCARNLFATISLLSSTFLRTLTNRCIWFITLPRVLPPQVLFLARPAASRFHTLDSKTAESREAYVSLDISSNRLL